MIHEQIVSRIAQGDKLLGVLIDPDKCDDEHLSALLDKAQGVVDYFFVGSSILLHDHFNQVIHKIRSSSNIPCIIFPGNGNQVSETADAILFLSLISGRNPEYLIGQHVIAAPRIKAINLEAISTGYMLIDGGNTTSVAYISNTQPIPNNKLDVAVATAIAGEMLGNKVLYMDAGSGPLFPISSEMIAAVRANVSIPIIVGGGIRKGEQLKEAYEAGADLVVVGNKIEEDCAFLDHIATIKKEVNGSNRIF